MRDKGGRDGEREGGREGGSKGGREGGREGGKGRERKTEKVGGEISFKGTRGSISSNRSQSTIQSSNGQM